MPDYLRDCPAPLALALQGDVELWSADLFKFTLVDGVTTFYWCAWPTDLVVSGQTYSSRAPWLKRSKWNVTNTMAVPSLTVDLMALNDAFNGGASIKQQIHNGVFDGASFLLSRAFMPTPNDTSSLGAIDLFGGDTAGIDLIGTTATITIKGKVNKLDQFVPRNIFQIGCNHAFCNPGCTLNRVTYTASYTVGASPTSTFIPWASAPASPGKYALGTIAFTSGPDSAQRRTITAADSSGLTLAYPLYSTPAPGDAFTAFEGCDKTFNSGSGQSCTDRANTQHYRGYEFIPPPNSSF